MQLRQLWNQRKGFTIYKSPENTCANKMEGRSDSMGCCETDEDGDLSPPRKFSARDDCEVITIGQKIQIKLVWRGALLLSDFLIYNEESTIISEIHVIPIRYDGCFGLELGAGLGLCSIILGRVAKRIFCTDVGDTILGNCKANIAANSHLFRYGSEAVTVHELDWEKKGLPTENDPFCWTMEDQKMFKGISVVLAADVIYDDSLTDAFIETVLHLFEQKPDIVLYLTMEKRLNFTLKDLAVTCPAYSHFIERINELENKQKTLTARKLSMEFPKYLQYERVKELELWEIKPT
ncbi:Methyltransferase-like protein 22 [Stylophora pistillata]|uniref:Methyltransferase-like protein 22 n=1 Tax=Stylophora pistillata TaxID=50429 RepID=A0A2B4SR75_STYPI|nr:Methyltransferase-like protein 22 [Stylophora pistillata]